MSTIPCKSFSNFKKQKRSKGWYFSRIWLHLHHQLLGMKLQFFKHVEHVHSINQMHLFWLIENTYFTYLKNCSSMINAWWWKCNQLRKKSHIFGCKHSWSWHCCSRCDMSLKLTFERMGSWNRLWQLWF